MDMRQFELSTDNFYDDSEKMHRSFRRLFDEVKRQSGFEADDHRISVQYFPSREGGCEMFISNLSGDREKNVSAVGTAVRVSETHHSLTPEEKYNKLDELISTSRGVMYVGDGINDSPSLARADVGIAMGSAGQDSAIEAADVVIMSDNLARLPEVVLIARKTINISWQNIVFALGVKGLILILGLLGFANMWLAVFADVGVAVLAILNSMRALRAPKA